MWPPVSLSRIIQIKFLSAQLKAFNNRRNISKLLFCGFFFFSSLLCISLVIFFFLYLFIFLNGNSYHLPVWVTHLSSCRGLEVVCVKQPSTLQIISYIFKTCPSGRYPSGFVDLLISSVLERWQQNNCCQNLSKNCHLIHQLLQFQLLLSLRHTVKTPEESLSWKPFLWKFPQRYRNENPTCFSATTTMWYVDKANERPK